MMTFTELVVTKNESMHPNIRVLTRILKTGFKESIPGKSWSQN